METVQVEVPVMGSGLLVALLGTLYVFAAHFIVAGRGMGYVGVKYSVKGRTIEEPDLFLGQQSECWNPFIAVFSGTPEERRALARDRVEVQQ
jgi:hypothetical protein